MKHSSESVRCARRVAVVLGVAALVSASIAQAQWVMLARQVVGRVQQMSQQQPNGGVAYDSAAVMVEVPAEKVYAVAVRNSILKLRADMNVQCSRAQ